MAEHGKIRVSDKAVPGRLFLSIGALVTVIATIYWFTAYEDAGTTLLALTGVMALWYGVYFWILDRKAAASEAGAGAEASDVLVAEADYLPHASVWPFVIGLGATTTANGLVLGIWVIVPGLFVLVLGIVGFLRQSRSRD